MLCVRRRLAPHLVGLRPPHQCPARQQQQGSQLAQHHQGTPQEATRGARRRRRQRGLRVVLCGGHMTSSCSQRHLCVAAACMVHKLRGRGVAPGIWRKLDECGTITCFSHMVFQSCILLCRFKQRGHQIQPSEPPCQHLRGSPAVVAWGRVVQAGWRPFLRPLQASYQVRCLQS